MQLQFVEYSVIQYNENNNTAEINSPASAIVDFRPSIISPSCCTSAPSARFSLSPTFADAVLAAGIIAASSALLLSSIAM